MTDFPSPSRRDDSALALLLGAAWRASPNAPQDAAHEAAKHLRPYLEEARNAIERRIREGSPAGAALKERAALIDRLLSALFTAMQACDKQPEGLVLLAVGGYGRGELFPYSDIDLLFLHEGAPETAAAAAEFILYPLWDLGFKIGHAVRDLGESLRAASDDMTVRTGLLDARWIAGDEKLFGKMLGRFRREVVPGSEMAFVEAKLAERDRRHARHGDTRYALEPNVKEGKGGLRDLHTLAWIVRYCYPVESPADWVHQGVLSAGELQAYTRAQNFLWKVRTHLHLAAGRAEERLGFDFQKRVAAAMGYGRATGPRSTEGFMKRYFQTAKIVGTLTRTVCAVLEEEKKRKPRLSLGALLHRQEKIGDWLLEGERLTPADKKRFAADPLEWFRLFALAQEEELDIHPNALRLIAHNLHRIDAAIQKNKEANALFLKILTSRHAPEAALRRLHEAGILGRFVADFGRVTGLMQYDRYHTLTVDEHTLSAIGMLHAIERGEFRKDSPVSTEIIHRLESKRVLYLALFCHDIAKGRGGDHSALGGKIAARLAARIGFSAKEQEDVAWLVNAHLLFSHTAFKRDLNDPETIRDFVALVQSPERLRLLLVLTVADIRAVGPAIWNGWKGALLRDLYVKAEALMGTAPPQEADDRAIQLHRALTALLPEQDDAAVSGYIDLGHPAFWSGCAAEEHAGIFLLLKKIDATNRPFATSRHSDAFQSVTRLALVTPDQHALFSKVAGAMALAGASIVTAKIFTLKNGMAVELFSAQDAFGKPFGRTVEKRKKFRSLLERALTGRMDFDKELAKLAPAYPKRADALKVPAAVFIDNTLSASHTVVEVNGRDRVGFLYHVTRGLAELHLNIATAIVATYGDRAVDVFYVKDIFGHKVTHEDKLDQIRRTLLKAASPAIQRKAA